ncbi:MULTISPECIES: hypothetical protein [Cohnella]|uniref:hypothetical protein n=1 Tax=Cohnella TaxID=329857 RepID=UPI0009BBD443|nr:MULTISPECIES: hypothetical protein [Cohnella]MBN2981450.1 hypothetical protein [Cohnella algarum]
MRQHKAMTIWLAAAALSACLVLTGCANRGTGNTSIEPQSYAEDGYMGRTSSYPKIPGRHMALGYKNDANLMRDAIRNVPGVAGSNITFNGADAYVTIKLAPGLQQREVATVERQAASVLRFNFPRYNVHVQSAR